MLTWSSKFYMKICVIRWIALLFLIRHSYRYPRKICSSLLHHIRFAQVWRFTTNVKKSRIPKRILLFERKVGNLASKSFYQPCSYFSKSMNHSHQHWIKIDKSKTFSMWFWNNFMPLDSINLAKYYNVNCELKWKTRKRKISSGNWIRKFSTNSHYPICLVSNLSKPD